MTTNNLNLFTLKKKLIYGYIAASLALCLGAVFFLPINEGYKLLLNMPGKFLIKSPAAAALFGLVFLLMFYLQAKIKDTLTLKDIYLLLAIVGVVFLISMPFFSSDVFLYSFKGKIQLPPLSQSPYQPVPPIDTPYRYLSVWSFTPTVYGPPANLLFKIFYFQAFSPYVNMYILKIIFTLFLVGLLIMCRGHVREKNLKFFMLSPVISIEVLLCGHMEIMPLFFMVAAFLYLKKGKWFYVFLFMGFATAFKLNYAVLMLPLGLHFLRREGIRNKGIRNIYLALVFPLPLMLSFLLYPDFNGFWASLLYEAGKRGVGLINLAAGLPGGIWVFSALALGLIVWLFVYYYRDRLDIYSLCSLFFLLFLLFDRNFSVWHMFPVYGIWLFKEKLDIDIAGLLAMNGIYTVYFFFYRWNSSQELWSGLMTGIALLYFPVKALFNKARA